jgi:hypothetical protein
MPSGLLRNILVHNAGRVDDIFHQGCVEKHLTKWAGYAEKSVFPTTGDDVCSLVDANLKCGYLLIGAVDDWLTANKPI